MTEPITHCPRHDWPMAYCYPCLQERCDGLQAEIRALRECFENAVETYPQSTPMPQALREWWRAWYQEYMAANRERAA